MVAPVLANLVEAGESSGQLADLLSYQEKHNLANGEDNRDGHGENFSWNNGVEGPSDDPEVMARRSTDLRALLVAVERLDGAVDVEDPWHAEHWLDARAQLRGQPREARRGRIRREQDLALALDQRGVQVGVRKAGAAHHPAQEGHVGLQADHFEAGQRRIHARDRAGAVRQIGRAHV